MFENVKGWIASGDAKAKLVVIGVMVAVGLGIAFAATGDISDAIAGSRR